MHRSHRSLWRNGLAAGAAVAVMLAGCGTTRDSGDVSASPAPPVSTAAADPAPSSAAASGRTSGPTAGSASAPTSGAAPGTGAATGRPRSVTIALAGDVLLHDGLWATARADARREGRTGPTSMDFRPMLAGLRPVIDGADLAICHLETPLAPPGGPFQGYPMFSGPPQVVPALAWLGFDACTTASNHTVDQGTAGVRRTLDDLDRAGLAHAGSARSATEAARPVLLDAAGVRVGLVSQTYGTNGMPVAAPWQVQLIDVSHAKKQAARARQAGADIVLVALHWGTEYQHRPTAEQREIAEQLLADPDIDLVYGHHAHVVQPFDRIRGKWVVYGLGNMIAEHETPVTGVYEGVTARFTFTRREGARRRDRFVVTQAAYVPTFITDYDPADPDMRLLDINAELPGGTAQASPAELRAARDRIDRAVHLLGAPVHELG